MAAKAKPEPKAKTWDRRPVMQREGHVERKEPYTTRLFPKTKAGLITLAAAWGCHVNEAIERLVEEESQRRKHESH